MYVHIDIYIHIHTYINVEAFNGGSNGVAIFVPRLCICKYMYTYIYTYMYIYINVEAFNGGSNGVAIFVPRLHTCIYIFVIILKNRDSSPVSLCVNRDMTHSYVWKLEWRCHVCPASIHLCMYICKYIYVCIYICNNSEKQRFQPSLRILS